MRRTVALGLEVKFGKAGRKLLPKIRVLHDLAKLNELADAIPSADSLERIKALLR